MIPHLEVDVKDLIVGRHVRESCIQGKKNSPPVETGRMES